VLHLHLEGFLPRHEFILRTRDTDYFSGRGCGCLPALAERLLNGLLDFSQTLLQALRKM